MICKNCKTKLRDGAVFCPKCGERVSINTTVNDKSVQNSKKKNNLIIPLILISVVVIGMVCLFIMLAFIGNDKDTDTDEEYEIIEESQMNSPSSKALEHDEVQPDERLEEQPEEQTEEQSEESANELFDANAVFAINSDTTEDYDANLDYYSYLNYNSGISNFYFSYPAFLYNSVEFSDEPTNTTYGTNLQTIHFRGEKGSELIYSAYQRTDNKSYEEMTEYIYDTKSENLLAPNELQNVAETDCGKIILTGYDLSYSYIVYDVTRIEQNYVFQMTVIFPDYVSSEDKLWKGYITECLYRMCSFSGSSASVRSFVEYSAESENSTSR